MAWSNLIPFLAGALTSALVWGGYRLWRRTHLDSRATSIRSRMLFDSSPVPTYAYDLDTLELLAVNETLCERYGYEASALIGQPVMTLHIASELEDLQRVFQGLRSSQDTRFRHRWTQRKRSGELIPVEVLSRPLRRNDVNIRVVTAVDISEKLRAEQALASQRRFQDLLLETLPVPVFYKDRDGRYLGVNAAFEQMMGRPREAFVGKTVWEIAPHDIAQVYHDADEALFATPDDIQVYEALVQSSALGQRDVIFTKAAFRDHEGRIGGLIGVVMDMTEQRASDRAVRESESRLAQTLYTSSAPTFVIDAEHRVTVWNPACEYTFGVPAADMIGTRRQWSAFYDAERPCMADIMLDGGGIEEIERLYAGRYRISPLNPQACDAIDYFPKLGRWLYFTAAPLRDSNGTVVGAIESFIDLSEQKRAQEEVERLNADLEQKVAQRTEELALANAHLRKAMQQLVQSEKLAALGSVVAGVSHELNTPMGVVLTAATSLQHQALALRAEMESATGMRRATLTHFIQDCIEGTGLVERNVQRAAALIRNFKDVAMDQTSSQRRGFALVTVVQDALVGLEDGLAQGGHRVAVDISPSICLDSFPGALGQIVTKLVENSLLHGFEGRTRGSIALSAHVDADSLHLFYQDDGVGMDSATVRRAFEPFFTSKLGQGGSGLGLYTVYNLSTGLLGGVVQLDSSPGTGVRFHFTLPLHAPKHQAGCEDIGGFL